LIAPSGRADLLPSVSGKGDWAFARIRKVKKPNRRIIRFIMGCFKKVFGGKRSLNGNWLRFAVLLKAYAENGLHRPLLFMVALDRVWTIHL
jgi:hypothetical protein